MSQQRFVIMTVFAFISFLLHFPFFVCSVSFVISGGFLRVSFLVVHIYCDFLLLVFSFRFSFFIFIFVLVLVLAVYKFSSKFYYSAVALWLNSIYVSFGNCEVLSTAKKEKWKKLVSFKK